MTTTESEIVSSTSPAVSPQVSDSAHVRHTPAHTPAHTPSDKELREARKEEQREARRQEKLDAAQIARDDKAADREERRRNQQFAAEQARLNQEAADARKAAQKAAAKQAREDAIAGAGEWLVTHRDDVLMIPLIAVPAILSWSAQSDFGVALYAGTGKILPVLSEVGMWFFAFRIEDARKHGEKLTPLVIGMIFCVLVCAGLSFAHGLLGPIPGSIPAGVLTGAAYALVAIAGIIIHQLGTAHRRRRAKKNARRRAPVATPAAPGVMTVTTLGATAGATGFLPGATAERPALLPAGGHGEGATPPAAIPGSPETGDGAILEVHFDADELSRPGGTQKAMRRYWDAAAEAGITLTGADLNRAVGRDPKYSLGKRYAREWRAEAGGGAQAPHSASDDAGTSTGTADAGEGAQ